MQNESIAFPPPKKYYEFELIILNTVTLNIVIVDFKLKVKTLTDLSMLYLCNKWEEVKKSFLIIISNLALLKKKKKSCRTGVFTCKI